MSSTISNKNPAKNGWGTLTRLAVPVSRSLVRLLVFCFLEVVGGVGCRGTLLCRWIGFFPSKKRDLAADMDMDMDIAIPGKGRARGGWRVHEFAPGAGRAGATYRDAKHVCPFVRLFLGDRGECACPIGSPCLPCADVSQTLRPSPSSSAYPVFTFVFSQPGCDDL